MEKGVDYQKILKIDIVIPSIRMDVEQLLSMLRMDVPPNVEIVYYVVTDSVGNKSRQLMHNGWPVYNIINSKNLGAALSRNVGLDKGSGDYVFFIDDDVVPARDILYRYVDAILAEPDAAGYVGPTVFPEPVNSFTRGVWVSGMLTFFVLPKQVEWMSWGTTSNLLLNKKRIGSARFQSVFPKHGGGEDVDFCVQVLNDSKKWFKTVPDAVVEHGWWKRSQRSYTRFFRWASGDSRLPRLYRDRRFYNFPNMVETLGFGLPVCFGLVVGGLAPVSCVGFGLLGVVVSEFVMEYWRVKKTYVGYKFTLRDVFEAMIIRLANDLGRFVGVLLYQKDLGGVLARFDFFGTRQSVPYERKIACGKFIGYCASFLGAFVGLGSWGGLW